MQIHAGSAGDRTVLRLEKHPALAVPQKINTIQIKKFFIPLEKIAASAYIENVFEKQKTQ